jgi:cyclophilin family peptidyl-prolyl cis-trans isomerase
MAKHKAPTQVTLASIRQETLFHQFVERYWKLGALLAVAVTIAILVPVYTRRQAQVAHLGVWDELRAQADLGRGVFGQIQGGSPEALAHFAEQHGNTPVGAWAKGLEVGACIKARHLDDAEKAASELAAGWPDHLLGTARIFPGADGSEMTLRDAVRSGKERLEAWRKEHANLFSNPPLPADAPRVRLNTSKGQIEVGLYSDRTPEHAANFLKLCKEGFYDGTKFHRVVRGSLIQGGDPNSIAGDPESWGLGGPEHALEPEADPRLRHFRGALAAWKAEGESRSHGSQFLLTTADQNRMDGQTVVFGIVLDGFRTIEAIESGAVVGDRPQDPATIDSVEIL